MLGIPWNIIVALGMFLTLLVAPSVTISEANSAEQKHGQVTIYSWGGSGNGGPYAVTIQTDSCQRTVRQYLGEGDHWDDRILSRAARARRVFCWTRDGSLVCKSTAHLYPAINNASCLGRNSWSGYHIIDACRESDDPIKVKVILGQIDEVIVKE